MTITPEQTTWFAETFEVLVANVGQALLGKAHVVRLALTCMLAEGHLLLEDAPGTGKTSLAKAIAATVGLIMPGLPSVLDHEDVRRRAEWPTPPRAPSPAR